MTDDERAVFLEIVEAAGPILDRADGTLVEGAASLIVTVREARRLVDERGLMVADRHGRRVPNPAVRVERDLLSELRHYLVQLGMSPAARARLGVPVQP